VHLRRSKREHARRAISSRAAAVAAEAAPALDYAPGCARLRLPWLQIAVYAQRCKALVEFKHEPASAAQRLLGGAGAGAGDGEGCGAC